MIVAIDRGSSTPLYRQIADGLRHALLEGTLKPGDRLPPGREMARSLGVNLETVQRAYRDLSSDGVVISRVGRGTQVSEDVDVASVGIASEVDALVDVALQLDVSLRDVIAAVKRRFDAVENAAAGGR